MLTGYKLIDEKTGEAVTSWGGVWGKFAGVPNPITLPNGDQVCGVKPGESFGGYRLDPWEIDDSEKPPVTVFDGATFMSRVTDEEYAAITASENIHVRRWLDTFRLRGEIDVVGSTAQAAKAGLVALGLLTQERADVVFATQ